MPERPLSESLADWFSHWDWTDDVDEEEGLAVVKEVAALEAENARLRETLLLVRDSLYKRITEALGDA